MADWNTGGGLLQPVQNEITVVEITAIFFRWAQGYYVKNGKVTKEVTNFKLAVRPLLSLYGRTKASEFGPRALKTVREKMIQDGSTRTYINKHIARIKRIFKWAVAEELVSANVYHALQAVSGLKKGRCEYWLPRHETLGPVRQ